MNSLSWMIYLADVVGSLSFILGLAFFLSSLIIAIVVPIGLGEREQNRRYGPEDKDFIHGDTIWRAAARKWWVPVALAVPLVLIPSSSTIYAIAASEYGEEILKSPTADKAVKALDAWLDRQITGESEK